MFLLPKCPANCSCASSSAVSVNGSCLLQNKRYQKARNCGAYSQFCSRPLQHGEKFNFPSIYSQLPRHQPSQDDPFYLASFFSLYFFHLLCTLNRSPLYYFISLHVSVSLFSSFLNVKKFPPSLQGPTNKSIFVL